MNAATSLPKTALAKPSLLLRAHWLLIGSSIVVFAALLRLLALSAKPLHHDEGVNGLFMMRLVRNGVYRYDPSNYHGPSLYYFALIPTKLNSLLHGGDGLSTLAIRLVPALFGIAVVWLMLPLHRYVGRWAAGAAAVLIAVSPGNLFFSRYFIHETLFIFFTLAMAVLWFRYRESGKRMDLILGAALAALLFATKETSVISFVVLALAWLCTSLYLKLRQSQAAVSGKFFSWRRMTDAGIALLLFAAISVVLYSSFFSNFPEGVYDSVRTYRVWMHTGTSAYQAPWFTYFQWLAREELPILLCGLMGILVALCQAGNRFMVFAAFWTMGMITAYSLVPYKTPWLTVNLILPLAIMAGYTFGWWYEFGRNARLVRASAVVTFVAAVGFSAWQAIDLSFYHYDDNSIAYVYAHTEREFLSLIQEIESVAAHNGQGQNTGITVMSPEYWPMPWYLRDFRNVGYWGRYVDTGVPIVIAEDTQSEEIEQRLGRLYQRSTSHDLRPGVRLVLYLRRDMQP
ncbi:MAG: hypothetical protein DMG65_19275 [Candidatus Angelobacter sp. Gp1-AA117]|nr:MAG: hypothetical protein DMG65_19275 [Candidatus Angelobacter sp. Gp1-AA117]